MASNARITERINAAGLEYYEALRRGDESAKVNAVTELYIQCESLFPKKKDGIETDPGYLVKLVGSTYSKYPVEPYELLSVFFCGEMNRQGELTTPDVTRFDPEKGPMEGFLRFCLKKRYYDAIGKEYHIERENVTDPLTGEKERRYVHRTESLEAPISGAGDDEIMLGDTLAADDGDNPDMRIGEGDFIGEKIAAMILRLQEMLPSKANTPKTRMQYKMCYTAWMTDHLKHKDTKLEPYYSFEREMFEAFQQPFLDFYCAQVYRSINAVALGHYKSYAALVDGKPDTELERVSNDVFVSFLERHEGYHVGESQISNQKKKLRELISEIVKRESPNMLQ